MTRFAALDASQKMTAVCVVDDAGRRMWRGQCPTVPEQINAVMRRHAGDDARIGIETGGMTPWLVHELRNRGLEVVCLDARHARAAAAHRKSSLARAIHLGWAEQKLILNPNWRRAQLELSPYELISTEHRETTAILAVAMAA